MSEIVTRRGLAGRLKAAGYAIDVGQVNAVLEAISQALVVPGDRVVFRGFGTFEVRVRKARSYRNPMTGSVTHRQATSFIHFKESSHVRGR
jgi:nucleoid DNA-binding protein